VEERDREALSCMRSDSWRMLEAETESWEGGVPIMATSSLTEELWRGRNGGGVRVRSSLPKRFQKPMPIPFLSAWRLKDVERRRDRGRDPVGVSMPVDVDIASSSRSRGSEDVGLRVGERVERFGSMDMEVEASDSRTCLITSASRRTSLSTGAPSSRRAARIRAKFLVLGLGVLVGEWGFGWVGLF
jgi:hypothetical protein